MSVVAGVAGVTGVVREFQGAGIGSVAWLPFRPRHEGPASLCNHLGASKET